MDIIFNSPVLFLISNEDGSVITAGYYRKDNLTYLVHMIIVIKIFYHVSTIIIIDMQYGGTIDMVCLKWIKP